MAKYFIIFFTLIFLSAKAEHPITHLNTAAYDKRSDSIDIVHTKIIIDFGDYISKNIVAHTILSCKAKQNALSKMTVDLRGLTVDSIKCNAANSTYTVNAQSINITFPSIFNTNDSFTLEFYYRGTPFLDVSDFGGFYWSANYAYNVGVSFKEQQHSYGRTWFPCFDNFVERSTFEFEVKTDSSRKAFCGGNLEATLLNTDGSRTWKWKLNQAIPSYLASVAVAKYTTLADTFNGSERTIPIQLGVLAADSSRMKSSFINLNNALRIFERSYGPYKFDRVGYSVTDYNGGAMEHACNITYPNFAVNGNLTYETLMAHELSHHWWGDLTTCESAQEMWLNEGWAVYSEYLFTEGMYGKSAYQNSVRLNHAKVLQFAHVRDSGYYALSNVPLDFTYGRTSYEKGADIAHTLRSYMGDTMFFRVLRDFMNANSYKDINSIELRDFISSASSLDASDFFEGWVLNPGFPQFSIDYSIYEAGHLKLWIKQKLNNAPQYFNKVPIEISVFDEYFNKQVFQVELNGKCTYIDLNLTTAPKYIALDFDEKLSDAISDEYLVIKSTGLRSYNTAKLTLDTRIVGADSILVRVEHNYVAPDAPKVRIPGLHVHNYRYWNIDGIFDDAQTRANATFAYNGTNSLTNGFLDNSFITNSEDSLVLLYRRDGTQDWIIFDSTQLFTSGSTSDKNGRVVAYNIKKGQYCFGIYDHRYEDTTYYTKDCSTSSILEEASADRLIIYPNPAADYIHIVAPQILSESCLELYDAMGNLLSTSNPSTESEITIDTKSINNGLYFIEYFNDNIKYFGKFLVVK